jgi:hypothetical protein
MSNDALEKAACFKLPVRKSRKAAPVLRLPVNEI